MRSSKERRSRFCHDPRQKIRLLDELLKRNPDTQYLPQALVIYLNSYRALGDGKNAVLFAERIE